MDVRKEKPGVNFKEGREEVIVWSPESRSVELCCHDKKFPLQKNELGYWSLHTNEIKSGDKYTFLLNGEKEFPDPASLSQSEGVHGPSRAFDAAQFKWKDEGWKNP